MSNNVWHQTISANNSTVSLRADVGNVMHDIILINN